MIEFHVIVGYIPYAHRIFELGGMSILKLENIIGYGNVT
jgi:hypothetical protein